MPSKAGKPAEGAARRTPVRAASSLEGARSKVAKSRAAKPTAKYRVERSKVAKSKVAKSKAAKFKAAKSKAAKSKVAKSKTPPPAASPFTASKPAPSKSTTPKSARGGSNSPVPRAATSAEHHRALRRQHESEAAQDYCEVIAELVDSGVEARVGRIAERFGLSHVTVSRVVRRLASEGYVVARAHAPLGLTARGLALATEARERHEIVVAFLRAIGVDERTAQADAEGIEHHVSPATLRAMARLAER